MTMSHKAQSGSGNFDAIVIGGGVHGLAAAALLQKRRQRVLLLESASELGGMYRSMDLGSGYRTGGMFPIVDQIDPLLISQLALAKHGLKMIDQPYSVGHLTGKGPAITLSSNLEASAALSAVDRDGLLRMHGFLGRIRDLFYKVITGPQINLIDMSATNLWEMMPTAFGLRMLGTRDMFDVIRTLPMCLADFMSEYLTNEPLKAFLSHQALAGTYLGPWSPGSTTNFILQHIARGSRVEGGGPALVNALTNAAQSFGVQMRCNAKVARITTENGQCSGVTLEGGETISASRIVSTIDSTQTLLKMLPARSLSTKTLARLRNFRSRGTSAVAHFGLKGDLKALNGLGDTLACFTGSHIDDLERSFDPVKYKEMPASPELAVYAPTRDGTATAPAGGHVLTVHAHFVPIDLGGGWTATAKEQLGRNIENRLESLLPGFSKMVAQRQLLSPADIETTYGTTGGHIHHGELSLDQFFMRPVPECSRYTTPVKGLILAGKGMQILGTMVGPPALHGTEAAR